MATNSSSLSAPMAGAAAAVAALIALCAIVGCRDRSSVSEKLVKDGQRNAGVWAADAWRADLLEIAFLAGSAVPEDPHRKTRAKLQESVSSAALSLGMRDVAIRYAEAIVGWRKGSALAEIALDRARAGARAEAEALIARAQAIADAHGGDDGAQDWQRDRIRARIAAAWLLLGATERAAALQGGLADAETSPVDLVRADLLQEAELDRALAAVDDILRRGSLEQARSVLEVSVRLFDRFHADPARREAFAARVRNGHEKLPIAVRVGLIESLATSAARHGDLVAALGFVSEAEAIVGRFDWLPEERVAVLARLAALRWRAGDVFGAKRDVSAARARYDAAEASIVDIHRAGAIRAIAVALAQIGDTAGARAAWQKAVVAGVANPNARPRAEDLVKTCVELARTGPEPDDSLLAALRDVQERLGAPW